MSDRVVWKYPLANRVTTFDVPLDSTIVLVGTDPASRLPCVWVERDAHDPESVEMTLAIVGTGDTFDAYDQQHVGSTIAGAFVWHIYRKVYE